MLPDDLPLRAMSVEPLATRRRSGDAADVEPPARAARADRRAAQAVARRAEPLLLSAAAGSGKTSVLVERFVAAVCEDGVAPARILAITFTERAAGELRERVRARLLELGDREAARDTEAASSARSTASARGCCAPTRSPAGLDPGLRDPRRGPRRRGCASGAFDDGARGVPRRRASATAVDLLAAYGVDRVRAMVEQRLRASCAAAASGGRACRLRAGADAGADAATSARRRCGRVALLERAARGFRRRATRRSSASAAASTSTTSSCSRGELLAEQRGRARVRGRSASSC